ncbi:actin cytoskeleton organization protein [Desarmillaria tabescens]|uniref:Actin cytoskeleton organization protein n=1 Tax=Armillaria tabescens TaxID=1929756 RepID=A0AA39T4G1_ARMTA|nr:actin cytoskeleton organization protein [Desarmillaria tabescens]KAK0463946.1 actin cytoskeleton organization protein [Desarmillaria tabescens]
MSSALDRQVRPIYDALDTGSNKSAIVTCNKILKKQPKNELVKALKALALVRSQKVEESLVLCDEVLAGKPTDDGVLTAMMHVLRGLGRHRDTVVMFEEAFKKEPTNEDLGAQTFLSNVRAGHWKSAQQIATKLYKTFQEDRYLLISSSPTPSYHSADRFHLHLSILRELKLYDEAMKLLDSEIGTHICGSSLVCNEMRRDIYRLKGLLKEEGKKAETLITEKKDRNWLEFLAVIDATFSTVDSDKNVAVAECSRVKDIFTCIMEQDGKRDRSGLLALLELEKRCRKFGLSTDSTRMVDLIQQYFEKIGDKACCFEDLLPYVDLDGDDLSRWTSYLKSVPSTLTTINELQRSTNCHKLLRHNLSQSDLTIEAERSRANLYTKQYLEGLQLGKDLPTTELQPADDLAILAGHAFISLWVLSKDEKYLLNAVSLLEFASSRSKQSFRIRLMLIRLYRILGAPSLALEYYRAMRIKQIQNDTLSHFLFSRSSIFSLAPSGDLTLMSEYIEASQIYINNSQDVIVLVDHRIPEFISFENRLECSLQRDISKLEHTRMRLAFEPVSIDVIDMELIESKFIFDRQHFDNRDYNVLPNYQPRIQQSLNEQTLLFGKSEGSGWLWSFLKLYVRAFQHGSDLDETVEEKLLIGDRPKHIPDANQPPLKERLCQRSEEELSELTPHELTYIRYADVLADWLEPYHDYVRPPPAVVLAEAAKQTELKTGHPLKGIEIPVLDGLSNGHKKDEEAPPVTEAPAELMTFFDDMKARFEKVKGQPSPTEALAVAALMQEALILFMLETLRFKPASVVKIHKLGNLVASFKTIRTHALAAVRDVSAQLVKMSENEGTIEQRKIIVDSCTEVTISELDHDFVLNVAKKLSDARKKVLEGYGKGMSRVCTLYAN